MTVSPGAGRRSSVTTRSTLIEPTTTTEPGMAAQRTSALLLPEGDLPRGRRRDDAAPPGRPLARLEQDGGAEVERALGRRADLGHLDVRQPHRALRRALDDAAPEPALAHVEREVRALRAHG